MVRPAAFSSMLAQMFENTAILLKKEGSPRIREELSA
jgi:hypothetical protein